MTMTRIEPMPSAVILSRGSTFGGEYPQPHDPPYTLPAAGSVWPAGATAKLFFYNNAGAQLAFINGTVAPGGITFDVTSSTIVDQIPNGANFELFLTTSDSNVYQIRHGKVIRKEAAFLQAPADATVVQLQFADSWPTTGLRSTWIKMSGNPTVQDNSGASLPNSVGVPGGTGSMRWYRQLNGNNFRVEFSILNLHNSGANTVGRLRVFSSADQYFSTGVGFELADTTNGSSTRTQSVAPIQITGSTTVAYKATATTHSLSSGDQYTLDYNDVSKAISLYAGSSESSLIATWADTGGLIPHGPGFRFLGLGWSNSGGNNGLQVTNWQAADYV